MMLMPECLLCRGKVEDELQWKDILSEVRTELNKQSASPSVIDYMIEQMSKQHQEAVEKLSQQQAKIHSLVDHINEVEVSIKLNVCVIDGYWAKRSFSL